jgi:GTPase Era involved in 16S rRNA processing
MPLWLQLAYAVMVLGLTAVSTWLAWRWLRPRKASPPVVKPTAVNADQIREEVAESLDAGIDIDAALQELEERERRRGGGEIHIAVFGEVSAGKSSLVSALVPGADTASDPRAGTTRQTTRYEWQSGSGDRVIICDLPGFNFEDDRAALEEARRAHLVVFLCDGDLPRSQATELTALQDLGKPLVLAINKADRFDRAELAELEHHLAGQTGLAPADIVSIRSGGREEIVRVLSDGAEERTSRDRGVDVEPLRWRIQYHLDNNQALMESLQESAVLLLISEKLDSAKQEHREEQATLLVKKYSQRAVIGALAAVAPGSDLVIQGILATRLIQELCQLYDVSVKEVQIESFLKLAGGKVRRMSALTMAIAGNALKAFPGLGTLTGGLLHAVAYGMIFDSLGRAAAQTLASRGEFRPLPAARAFEEIMNENLATGASRFARLAITSDNGPESS